MRLGYISLKALAMVIVLGVTSTYVFAAGSVFGRLTTRNNKQVLVNGRQAMTGETIVSGAQIQTPANVDAAVQLATLGSVQIDADSVVTVDFDRGMVNLRIASGNAYLATAPGVKGVITAPDGRVVEPGSAPAPAPAPAGGISTGMGFAIGLGALSLIIGVIALNRANTARDCAATGRPVVASVAQPCTL
jgi:hypothetical protein